MQDRRKTARMRTYFGGQIAFNQRSSVMDCLVRNVSPDGAKLIFTNTVAVPQEFDLSIRKDARTLRARVIWRRADEAGVAFVRPEAVSPPVPIEVARRLRDCEAEKVALRERIKQLSTAE
jgi:hypothetical protein